MTPSSVSRNDIWSLTAPTMVHNRSQNWEVMNIPRVRGRQLGKRLTKALLTELWTPLNINIYMWNLMDPYIDNSQIFYSNPSPSRDLQAAVSIRSTSGSGWRMQPLNRVRWPRPKYKFNIGSTLNHLRWISSLAGWSTVCFCSACASCARFLAVWGTPTARTHFTY